MTTTSAGIVSGERQASHEQIEARARHVAGALAALGVGPGDCVALLMRNDIGFLEISYGVARLGAYAVPINWHFKPEEVAYILADCGAKAIFGHPDLLAPCRGQIPAGLPVIIVPTPPEVSAAYGGAAGAAGADALPSCVETIDAFLSRTAPHGGPALPAPQSMIYTSGTTGHPKGVRRKAPSAEENAKTERLRSLVYGVRQGVRALMPGPLYHSAPNSFALRAGRIADVLVLMPRFEPEQFLALVEKHRIETVLMVPTMFIRLLKLPETVRKRYDTSSLRHVIHAAAPCPPDVKAAMIAWWGPVIREFYGGTESGPVTYATSEDALRKPGTVGRPAPGAEIRILDERDRPLPSGRVGEIYSRLDGYPDFTYHNAPEKRREVDRDGFITCGDIGYVDADGYVYICDRKRDMVISGGVNIYPAEIETVLHAIPGVHDCAVFGIPDAEYGEALLAVVEPQSGLTLDVAALKFELQRHLADYKVPRHIEVRTGLPREDSGKIFKRRLRDPYWQAAGRRI